MTIPDYRAALQNLLDNYDLEWRARDFISALLAAPEAVGVADEKLLKTYCDARRACNYEGPADNFGKAAERAYTLAGLRAVLSRYGTVHHAPVPVGGAVVPIDERWPDEEDLPCWWMVSSDNPDIKAGEGAAITHWSSHSALMALNGARARAMLDEEEAKL